MLFEEGIIYLRAMLGDSEVQNSETGEIVPPEYSDDDLGLLLAIGIKQVQIALDIPKCNRIPVSMKSPYVDAEIDICDDLFELIILNTMCRLQKRNIESQFNLDSISTTIGPVSLKLSTPQWSKMPKYVWESTSPCVEYDKKLVSFAAFDVHRTQAVYAIRAGITECWPISDLRSGLHTGLYADESMIN